MACRRTVVGVVAGIAAAASVVASAASLGSVSPTLLGAGGVSVSGCDTDGVQLAMVPTFDVDARTYVVSAVHLSGLSQACIGQVVTVQLTGSDGPLLHENETIAGTAHRVRLTAPVPVADVASTDLVITG